MTAWSATEAETDALATTISEAIKLQPLAEALLGCTMPMSVRLYGDNSGSIQLLNRDVFHKCSWRTRAFALRAAWVRDQMHEHGIPLEHHPGATLIADLLTKTLSKTKLRELRELAQLLVL